MILNPFQAKAIANAMSEMNNVGGVISTFELEFGAIHVYEFRMSGVKVIQHDVAVEDYANQDAFFTAYSLN